MFPRLVQHRLLRLIEISSKTIFYFLAGWKACYVQKLNQSHTKIFFLHSKSLHANVLAPQYPLVLFHLYAPWNLHTTDKGPRYVPHTRLPTCGGKALIALWSSLPQKSTLLTPSETLKHSSSHSLSLTSPSVKPACFVFFERCYINYC